MRYGHVEQSLKQQTMSAKLVLDCNLIVEIESVRILGFPGYFATRIHLLPPNRPCPGIKTTYCGGKTAQRQRVSYGNSTGSSPDGLQFARRAECLPATVTTHRCGRRRGHRRPRGPVSPPLKDSILIAKGRRNAL